MQVYNDTVPTTPALNPDSYGNCYGMVLDGYVDVARNDNITFLNGTVDNSFYNKYRVCIRYNGHVSVTLAGQTIVTSSAVETMMPRLCAKMTMTYSRDCSHSQCSMPQTPLSSPLSSSCSSSPSPRYGKPPIPEILTTPISTPTTAHAADFLAALTKHVTAVGHAVRLLTRAAS